ncbi:carboxypeptidase-like regulatory domain-containing protein [uncultured Polaribacter sp.]|uniref:carboxypeptidase-like regulatory domain-containing protein n=1 Tax=uncultured Polaribacter sp. TaxID=174711 RepID=UPI00261F30DB|nr:carboxypeptidase-like regulatory domain-containing protein [uncultured Polaribacter sp.]
MKKIFYTLLLLVPISFLAQTTIKGKVIDDTKYPLPGASIIVKGSTRGEVTDFDGNFSIKIDKTPAILVVSYLGYKTKEVVVNKQTTLTIQLEQDSEQLEEIVIIGYGSSTKKDLTGSLTEIKEKENVASQYNSVGSLLQGRSSGLQVNSNIGTPGAPVSVRIRGANSLRGNNEPLYVVDGVIINSAGEDVLDATSDANETQSTQNGLTGINPRDIESMVVLKDASATAIYGSRGANGVILITTKKGKQGKAVINTFVQSSISQATKKINVLDAVGYAQYRNVNAIQQNNPPNYAIEGNKVFRLDNAGNKLDKHGK